MLFLLGCGLAESNAAGDPIPPRQVYKVETVGDAYIAGQAEPPLTSENDPPSVIRFGLGMVHAASDWSETHGQPIKANGSDAYMCWKLTASNVAAATEEGGRLYTQSLLAVRWVLLQAAEHRLVLGGGSYFSSSSSTVFVRP